MIFNRTYKNIASYLLILFVYLLTRLFGLDSDIPLGWTIIEYQIFDEMFYNLPAINLFHYGQWDITKYGMSFVDYEVYVSLPFWNIIAWLFLESGASPLVAVRLPAVIAGAVAYTFFIFLSAWGPGGGRRNQLHTSMEYMHVVVFHMCVCHLY